MDTTNCKIICIVKNDSSSPSEGLRQAFHEKTNNFVRKYFYTDSNTFSTCFGNNTDKKFLLIKQGSAKSQNGLPENVEAWDILLVCDNVPLDDIKKIPFTGETLVMYHQVPTDAKQTFEDLQKEKKIKKCKQGSHVHDPDEGYTLLLELTQAWNGTNFDNQRYNQAKEKLIKWFDLNEKLNKALEFLHSSLGENPADTKILTEGDEPFDLSNYYYKDESLQNWIDKLNDKTGYAYNAALANVRDALLWHAGVTGEN